MSKKIVKVVVGFILTAIFSFGFLYVSNSFVGFTYETPSETFVGKLSENSYFSKTDTARAYISEEFSGSTSNVSYSGYQKISDLTESEINALPLEDSVLENINAGEKVVVSYSCNGEDKTSNTCLLKAGSRYHYFVEPSIVGEAITNSYFESCLDGSKYLNCTATTTLNLRVISDSMSTDSIYRQVIQFNDNVAYIDQELPGMEYEMYFKENDERIAVYLKHPQRNDGIFYTLSEINSELRSQGMYYEVKLVKGGEQVNVSSLSSMQQITDFMFMMPVDASYFVKTNFGFSMPNEKYKEVCKMMSGGDAYLDIENAWREHKIHFNSDYYVTNGRLSASKTILTMTDGEDVFALTITVNYTDFGKTSVTIPGRGQ